MAAIIASVAPHDTVISTSASTSRPQADEYLRAIAERSAGAPQVVAYWLYPSRRAFAAASRIRGSGSKSGKPWAKLTAFSGPCSARLSRVISRMTDSVKLFALRDCRGAVELVSGIGALQMEVGARAGEAALRALQASLPPAADVARPSRLGEEVQHVGPAEQPDHLSAPDHRHPADALPDQKPRRLVDAGLLGDRDDAWAHDVARGLAPLGEDVGLGDDAHHVALSGDHGSARDVLRAQDAGDLVDGCVLAERDHVARHHLFDRNHGFTKRLAP